MPRRPESISLTSPKTSKPDSSATKPLPPRAFDKLYWIRIGFGVIAGVLAYFLSFGDITNGILIGIMMYLVSFYLARYALYKGIARDSISKLYTTGLPGFVGLYLITWILIFTLAAM